jgi:hypothetical protein
MTAVSNFRNKNEKASWMRKKRNLEALVDELAPVEETLRELNMKKDTVLDKIEAIRLGMVKECIHPIDYLVHYETYIICRFCESKLRMVGDNDR